MAKAALATTGPAVAVVAFVGCWLVVLSCSPALAQSGGPVNQNTLRSVTALDDQRAWAVGDRGTILRTVDGGQTWLESGVQVAVSSRQQALDPLASRLLEQVRQDAGTTDRPVQQTIRRPVDCGLFTVTFADGQRGWAAGGAPLPLAGGVRGRLLSTADGGATWSEVPVAGMPLFRRLKMNSAVSGWATGWPGSLLEGGAFDTADGARSWMPSASGAPPMTDGDRSGGLTVGVAEDGWLWRLEQGRAEPAVIVDRTAAAVHRVRLVDERIGWAVGDCGTLLSTTDGGRSWNRPELPEEQRRLLAGFDLRALVAGTEEVLFAGSPGTAVFRLDRATGSLTMVPTGTAATIHDLALQGDAAWAVGARGLVLASRDRGTSWSIQRGGAAEIALLTVAIGDGDGAWETHARFAAEENLASVACQLPLELPERLSAARFAEAAMKCGATDMAPLLPQPGTTGLTPERRVRLQRRMAILVRQLRPLVVVSNSAFVAGDGGARIDVHSFLDEVLRLAGSESELPASEAGGLVAWQVPRLATRESIGAGDWSLDAAAWLTRTGRTVADHVMISRAMTGLAWQSPAQLKYRITCRLATDRPGQAGGLLPLRMAGPERHCPIAQPSAFNAGLAGATRATAKTAELERLSVAELKTQRDRLTWRGQINLWSSQADEELAGIWLAQLAIRSLEKGRLDLAAEAVGQLLAGHPRHPLANDAAIWLSSVVASHEAWVVLNPPPRGWSPGATATDLDRQVQLAALPSAPALIGGDGEVQHLVWTPEAGGPPANSSSVPADGVIPASATLAEPSPALPPMDFPGRSAQLNQLTGVMPDLAVHPRMLLAQSSLIRQQSGWQAAESILRRLAADAATTDPAVQSVAVRERALVAGPSALPAELRSCPFASARPKLDGSLDDAVWDQLMREGQFEMIAVRDPGKPGSARTDYLFLAHDEQFLYCAGRIAKAASTAMPKAVSTPRVRDGMDPRRDHVRVMLDPDRDGAWPFWLSIDEQGGLADGVGDSASWNPQWFAASAQEAETAWTFELAIAWSQLGLAGPPAPDAPMGLALNRAPASNWPRGWDTPAPGIPMKSAGLVVPAGSAGDYRLLGFGTGATN